MSNLPGYYTNLEKEKEFEPEDKLQNLAREYIDTTSNVGTGQQDRALKLIKKRYHLEETSAGNSSAGKHLKRFSTFEGGRTVNLRTLLP